MVSIDDPRALVLSTSCLVNRTGHSVPWLYMGSDVTSTSAIMVRGGSLPSNRTYQFVVFMENRHNASLQATGYLLVQVPDAHPQLVLIG
jgi:hypothetical protein